MSLRQRIPEQPLRPFPFNQAPDPELYSRVSVDFGRHEIEPGPKLLTVNRVNRQAIMKLPLVNGVYLASTYQDWFDICVRKD